MSSFLGKKELARGIRNNNPGNLVITSSPWVGKIPVSKNTDKRFEQFEAVKFGIRAMLIDLINDIGKGKNTINKLISEYAPSHENNTVLYVDTVAKALKMDKNKVITNVDFDFLFHLAKAIIKHENGNDAKYIADSDIFDACDILDRKEVNGVVIVAKRKFKFNIIIVPILVFLYTVFTVTV